jgi:hypothetical protein
MNTTQNPTQAQYEAREAEMHTQHMQRLADLPLNERRESMRDFAACLESLGVLAERIQWLIEGDYGFGAMQAAKRILEAKRGNRHAQLFQLIAGCEFQVCQRDAIKVWKSLTYDQQILVERTMQGIFQDYKSAQDVQR